MTIPYVARVIKPMWATWLSVNETILFAGQSLELIREWNNRHDPNAVGVWIAAPSERRLIGYLEKTVAAVVAMHLENGHRVGGEPFEDTDLLAPVPTLKIRIHPCDICGTPPHPHESR